MDAKYIVLNICQLNDIFYNKSEQHQLLFDSIISSNNLYTEYLVVFRDIYNRNVYQTTLKRYSDKLIRQTQFMCMHIDVDEEQDILYE